MRWVSPRANVAAIIRFSVAPTDTLGKTILAPVRPAGAAALMYPALQRDFRAHLLESVDVQVDRPARRSHSHRAAIPAPCHIAPATGRERTRWLASCAPGRRERSYRRSRAPAAPAAGPTAARSQPSMTRMSTPMGLRRLAMVVISARHGTFARVRASSVRMLAAMMGRAAFLAPLIGITPFSEAPPLITILSNSCSLSCRPGWTSIGAKYVLSVAIIQMPPDEAFSEPRERSQGSPSGLCAALSSCFEDRRLRRIRLARSASARRLSRSDRGRPDVTGSVFEGSFMLHPG